MDLNINDISLREVFDKTKNMSIRDGGLAKILEKIVLSIEEINNVYLTPEFIEYKKDSYDRFHKRCLDISKKHNLSFEFVKCELSKGLFSDSKIWDIIISD